MCIYVQRQLRTASPFMSVAQSQQQMVLIAEKCWGGENVKEAHYHLFLYHMEHLQPFHLLFLFQ